LTFILLWDIIGYKIKNERGKMDNVQQQIVVLAQINQLKEMQIFCLNKEKELQEELRDLKKEENK
tara:strand:+ start:436 stop:630 length:195 start_codon:yes stop_codon:yes gene_type:complete